MKRRIFLRVFIGYAVVSLLAVLVFALYTRGACAADLATMP